MAGLLGVVTLSIVATQYRTNRIANVYLLLLFLILSIRFFIAGLNELSILYAVKAEFLFYSPFLVAVFPCVYLYFKKLTSNQKKFEFGDFKHFVLPILMGFTHLLIINKSVYLSYFFHFFFILMALFYVYLSYLELKNGVWTLGNKFNIVEKQKKLLKNWTLLIFIICVLSVIRLFVCLLLDLFSDSQSYGSNYLWITAIFSCVLFFKVLITPEILFGYHLLEDKINERRKSDFVFGDFWIYKNDIQITNIQDLKLSDKVNEHLSAYISEIENLAFQQKWFRNSSVSIGDLASKMGVPKSHLTYLFKYHSKMTFIDFKKTVRIYDSIHLIEVDYLKSNTLDSLAREVGFSSYNPFFTSFKEILGMVPQDYNKQIKQV
ncbi:hypothetical protein FUMI01_18060 [Flavobacterium sp. UMI-01]|nr:hypothetical protein FUMI01_18060 [Flavobacterium sp. UMI-01]